MQFELERQERILNDLQPLIYKKKVPVERYELLEGQVQTTQGWQPYCTADLLVGNDRHRWLRTTITISADFAGYPVDYILSTGREGEWDATNPQALLYLDGKPLQGIDVNHTTVRICEVAEPGTTHQLSMLLYSGSEKEELLLKSWLAAVDLPVEKLYYHLLVLVESAKVLGEGNDNARRILVKSAPAADALDLRQPGTNLFYQSVERTTQLLETAFYTRVDDSLPVVSAIGHTHIDIAWLWTVAETREKALRSFSTVLKLMEEYPEYKFMSSQPILYQFVKEQQPELYARIKEQVANGRWEVDGAMWLEADCNLTGGESFVRQIIRGERFFREEFGIESRCLWLPDVFGYSAALPQILQKCGIPYFMTTKISWNQYNSLPNDTFLWRGIDGSEVFTYMSTTSEYNKNLGMGVSFSDKRNTTTYTGNINPNMAVGTYDRFRNKDLSENTLMLYGFGDGGGGPTREMLEQAKRLQYGIPGIPRIQLESERKFFDRTWENLRNNPNLPRWTGELYFEYHRGTYTSMAKNKWYNRKNELAYRDLECLSTAMLPAGASYPSDTIERGWDVLLLNQFHDIIPGTCIEPVYKVTDLEYSEILNAAHNEIDCQLQWLAVHSNALSGEILVYNTQGYRRSDLVCLPAPQGSQITAMRDSQGVETPVQYLADGNLIFFARDLPPMGYGVYTSVYGQPATKFDFNGNSYENEWYSTTIDNHGRLLQLIEKDTGRNLLGLGKMGNELISYEDRPMNWDNWDIDRYHKNKPYPVDEIVSTQVTEQGPVRCCLQVVHRYLESLITQNIYLYPQLPRIDFDTHVQWQQHHVLLKAGFGVDLNATRATYEIQFGNVEREITSNHSWDTAKFETCAHKWADISEQGVGISLLNDSKYGYDIREGQMSLTLIKAGTYPNPNADIGDHRFVYSIYPHIGGWRQAQTVEQAYNLNSPLVACWCSADGDGSIENQAYVQSDRSNCFVETLKRAEDGNGVILRVYENQNNATPITLTLARQPKEVFECDLLERNLHALPCDSNHICDKLKPYEIKTYRIIYATP